MVEIEDKSSVHRCKSSRKVLESNGYSSSEESNLTTSFVELLSVFLKGNCPHDSFRPLPPMLGNGHSIDLLKLYCVVKQKGGFDSVSKNGLWGEVGLIYGVDSSFGSAIKLIYLKYLVSLESWLAKLPIGYFPRSECPSITTCSEGPKIKLEVDFSSFVCNIMEEIEKKSDHYGYELKTEKSDLNFANLAKENGDKKLNRKKIKAGFIDVVDLTENFDDGKLKRKSVEIDSANDAGLSEGSRNAKKSKRKTTDVSIATYGNLTEVNNEEKKMENMKSEISFADVVSLGLADAKRFSVGPEVADNVIMGSGDSGASEEPRIQPERSIAGDEKMLKEECCEMKLERAKSEMNFDDADSPNVSDSQRSSPHPKVADDAVISSENSYTSKKDSSRVKEELMNVDENVVKEVSSHESRKDGLSRMIRWLAKVSKDPTNLTIGKIPQSTECAYFGDDCFWKQALLAREALFLKRNKVSGGEQLSWQRKQKMHPSMYDDQIKSAERWSPRLLVAKTPSSNQGRFRQRLAARIDLQPTAAIYTCHPQQRIPVGRDFQAEVPEWTGEITDSDSKWFGTLAWPPEKRLRNSLIERDPIGRGRFDGCGCQVRGSTECVRFHISERRTKMELELGPAFYSWNFDRMGEECSVSWTAEDEKKFKTVVKENPLSLNKFFWPKLCKVLPKKSWPEQVNYFFNVFILQRRAIQNRVKSCEIDSDDDETDYQTPVNNLRT